MQPPNFILSVFIDIQRVKDAYDTAWVLPQWTLETEALEVPTGVLSYPSPVSHRARAPSSDLLSARVVTKATDTHPDPPHGKIYSPFIELNNSSDYTYCLFAKSSYALRFNNYRNRPGKGVTTGEIFSRKLLSKDTCVDPHTTLSFQYVVQEEPRFFPYCVIINASDDTIDLLSLRSYFRSYEPHGITFNVARAGLSFYERLHCRDDEVLDLVSAKAGLR